MTVRNTARLAGLGMLFLPIHGLAQEPGRGQPLSTPAEQAGYLAFTAADEVIPFLTALAEAAGGFELDTLAVLNDGTGVVVPVPIARIPVSSAPGESGPVRVLILASQHGTERAGLEVGLRIIRDLVDGDLGPLRRTLDVRVVPMTNPLGIIRRTIGAAGGIDLDDDHVALAAAETRAIWAEVVDWRPHLVLDLHELGPSEYTVQIGAPTHPNVNADLVTFARYYMLPQVANRLARADIRFHESVVAWTENAEQTYYTPAPLDAGYARNAFALAGAVSFLVETSSSRDIMGLEERTERMYVATRAFLEAATLLADDLTRVVEHASALPDTTLSIMARFAATASDSRLSWVQLNDRGLRVRAMLSPWFPSVEVDAELSIPAGWMIDGSGIELIGSLMAHGFEVERMAEPVDRSVQIYPACPEVAADSSIGQSETRRFPAGAWWVPADQPGARLLFTIVEPWSEDGWIATTADFDCGRDTYPVYRVPA
jgi:hypothetical protein